MPSDEFKSATHGSMAGITRADTLILCDVDGTLSNVNDSYGDNESLIKFLSAAKKAGFEVVIFSNEPSGAQLKVKALSLKYFKDQNYFGAVESKAALEGQEALFVIDDDHESHKASAKYQLSPDYGGFDKMVMGLGFIAKLSGPTLN